MTPSAPKDLGEEGFLGFIPWKLARYALIVLFLYVAYFVLLRFLALRCAAFSVLFNIYACPSTCTLLWIFSTYTGFNVHRSSREMDCWIVRVLYSKDGMALAV